MSYFKAIVAHAEQEPEEKHPLGWDGNKANFPPEQINNPPKLAKGLWVGVCVFCGGSLGGPYQEDLYHSECLSEEGN